MVKTLEKDKFKFNKYIGKVLQVLNG